MLISFLLEEREVVLLEQALWQMSKELEQATRSALPCLARGASEQKLLVDRLVQKLERVHRMTTGDEWDEADSVSGADT